MKEGVESGGIRYEIGGNSEKSFYLELSNLVHEDARSDGRDER
jgi:hypothetical protein